MVAAIARQYFHRHLIETCFVEQVSGKLTAGTWKVRTVICMFGNNITHPHLRAEHQGQKNHG